MQWKVCHQSIHSGSKLIIFVLKGRIGNHLFQYAALSSMAGNQRLVILGCSELNEILEGIQPIICGKRESRFGNALLRIAEKLLNFLANDLRLISEIKQVQHKNKPSEIVVRRGLIKFVQYCSGFFQEEKFLDPGRLQEIRLRPELVELARSQLSNTTDHREKIFIHIRRGDYLSWPSPQAPAVLPDEWYFEAMSKMREKYSDPFFLFFSDDPDYVKEKFGHLPNTWISRNDAKTDLAMMAECQAGILSASSFAWWAAFFSRRNNKNGVYIAPKYWAGHRNKEWHPFIRTEWQEYLSVDSGPSQLEG